MDSGDTKYLCAFLLGGYIFLLFFFVVTYLENVLSKNSLNATLVSPDFAFPRILRATGHLCAQRF